MDKFNRGFDLVLQFINAIPDTGWYVAGTVIGGSVILIGIVAWTKRHHLKKWAEKLEDYFVQANLIVWGTILAVASFVITYGTNFGNLLPYLTNHMPQITLLATSLYTFSKPLKKWFADRKASKKHLTDEIPAILQAPAAPQPVTQFPPTQPPSSDLLR